MTMYVIRYQGGFYNKHWSPLAVHEAINLVEGVLGMLPA